jgi:hypothetical protein
MTKKAGSQIPLYTDKEVRRDYFKSPQWVKQHLKMKVHLTGFACVYEEMGARPKNPDRPPKDGRYQGSLFSQQKHAIADAVEWIRRNSKYKPRIFVATTPGFLEPSKEGSFISKLTDNLKKGYGMQEYVWVREYTKKGFPHFHFVADVDKFDPVALSLRWSSYFGSEAKNSIRCGTKPDKLGRRSYWIKTPRMAFYMSKYIGKSIDEFEALKGMRKPRTFAISQLAAKESQPLTYQAEISQLWTGLHSRRFSLIDDQIDEGVPMEVNPKSFRWKWTGHGQTYIGFKRDTPTLVESTNST